MKEMYEKWIQNNNKGSKDDFFKLVIDPLNKKIRKYNGDNSFVLSSQKELRNSKNNYEYNGRKYKILSNEQYKVIKSILE